MPERVALRGSSGIFRVRVLAREQGCFYFHSFRERIRDYQAQVRANRDTISQIYRNVRDAACRLAFEGFHAEVRDGEKARYGCAGVRTGGGLDAAASVRRRCGREGCGASAGAGHLCGARGHRVRARRLLQRRLRRPISARRMPTRCCTRASTRKAARMPFSPRRAPKRRR